MLEQLTGVFLKWLANLQIRRFKVTLLKPYTISGNASEL